MEQRFSLDAAGKLIGITTNAMRSRAKKNPEKYRIERDNSGKIWVWIDPEKLPSKPTKLKPSTINIEGSKDSSLKASFEALEERIEGLKNLLASERRRADAAEADRDAWRYMAQRPWWKRLAG